MPFTYVYRGTDTKGCPSRGRVAVFYRSLCLFLAYVSILCTFIIVFLYLVQPILSAPCIWSGLLPFSKKQNLLICFLFLSKFFLGTFYFYCTCTVRTCSFNVAKKKFGTHFKSNIYDLIFYIKKRCVSS